MSPEENATIDGTDVGTDADLERNRPSDDPALYPEPGELQDAFHMQLCNSALGLDPVEASKDLADRSIGTE